MNEARGLRWSEIDEKEGTARVDGSHTKNGEAKEFTYAVVPLARRAMERATAMRLPESEGGSDQDFVFYRPHRGHGARKAHRSPIGDFRKVRANTLKPRG